VDRIDLSAGTATRIANLPTSSGFSGGTAAGALVADSSTLWMIVKGNCASGGGQCSAIASMDPSTASGSVLSGTVGREDRWPGMGSGRITVSGDYLYVTSKKMVFRFAKSDGTLALTAGSGASGFVNGVGSQAWFKEPAGVDADGSTLWVADRSDHRIRKIVPANPLTREQPVQLTTTVEMDAAEVSTAAGSGAGGSTDVGIRPWCGRHWWVSA
jgi:hypothetical protein